MPAIAKSDAIQPFDLPPYAPLVGVTPIVIQRRSDEHPLVMAALRARFWVDVMIDAVWIALAVGIFGRVAWYAIGKALS